MLDEVLLDMENQRVAYKDEIARLTWILVGAQHRLQEVEMRIYRLEKRNDRSGGLGTGTGDSDAGSQGSAE